MGGNTPIDFLLEGSDIELLTLYVVKGVGLPETLPEHDVAIVVASDSEECREALAVDRKGGATLAAAAAQSPRSDRQPRSRQAVSAAGGHALVSTFQRPFTRRARNCPISRRTDRLRGHRGRTALSDDRAAARHACRRRAREARRCGGARRLSRRAEEQDFFVARFVDYVESRRALPQISPRHGRRQALRLPHGDRRSLGHLVSQRLYGVQRGEAGRRSRLHARLRPRLRGAPRERARRDEQARRPRLFHRRLRREPERRAAGVRGRQHRRRAQHGFAGRVSVQAAADAQDLCGVHGDAVAARTSRRGSAA